MKPLLWLFLTALFYVVQLKTPAQARKGPGTIIAKNRPMYMRARYAGLCEDKPGEVTGNFTITYIGQKFFVNGLINVLKDLQLIHQVVFTIHQCKSPAENINCELFQTWRFGKETCALILQKNAIWSPIFQAFEPELKCPILKRSFKIVNSTLDLTTIIDLFGASLLEKHFWRARINVFDDQNFFTGICFGLSFLRGKH